MIRFYSPPSRRLRPREQKLCRIQDPAAGIRFPATRGQPAPLCKGQPSLFVRAAKPGRHNVSRRSLPASLFRQCTGLGALRPQCEKTGGQPGARGGAVNGVRQENSQPRRSGCCCCCCVALVRHEHDTLPTTRGAAEQQHHSARGRCQRS